MRSECTGSRTTSPRLGSSLRIGGFKGIQNFDRYRFSDEHNCSKARDVARGAAVTGKEGCYYYKDGGVFVGWENNCQLYQFDFESYEGSDHGDGHHPRDCRAKGPKTGR